MATLYFGVSAVFDLQTYYSLTRQIRAEKIEWETLAEAEDRFYLKGHYTFQVKGNRYEGESALREMPLRSPYAVEIALKEMEKIPPPVYFNPSNPKASSLEHTFPYKTFFSALTMGGLFVYFIWLGYYVGRMNPSS